MVTACSTILAARITACLLNAPLTEQAQAGEEDAPATPAAAGSSKAAKKSKSWGPALHAGRIAGAWCHVACCPVSCYVLLGTEQARSCGHHRWRRRRSCSSTTPARRRTCAAPSVSL